MKIFFFTVLFCFVSCKTKKEYYDETTSSNFTGILKTESNFNVIDSTLMTKSELEGYKKTHYTTQYFSDKFFKEEIVGQNEFTIYDSDLESIFLKKGNTDTIYVQKYLGSTDKMDVNYEIIPNRIKILGYECDLILYKDEKLNMDFEIYYSKKIKTALKFSHSFNNILKDFIILKYVIKTPSLEVFYNVTDIIPKKIEKIEFEINPESALKYIK